METLNSPSFSSFAVPLPSLATVHSRHLPSLAGGIHLPNLPHLLHSSVSPIHQNSLDGIALISDIVASPTPGEAARALREVLDSYRRVRSSEQEEEGKGRGVFRLQELKKGRSAEELVDAAINLLAVVREKTPLAHQVRTTP